MRETELKLSVHASFVVPDQLDPALGLTPEEGPTLDLRATYYDSEDLRLARSGVTLRHRSGEGPATAWTLKLPIEDTDLTSRDEHHFPGSPTSVPEEARDLVTAYLRNESLVPVARLTTKRRSWLIKDTENETVAEIDDDEVSILEGRRVVARFREIEVESKGASLDELFSIRDALVAAGAMPAEPIPKAVRALGPRATADPDLLPARDVGPDDPSGETVRAALISGARRLIAHDPSTRLGEEEALHQMRVAARRLRSDLRTFTPLVQPEWSEQLTAELKWLVGVLGSVRDLDVLQTRLQKAVGGLEEDCKELFGSLSVRHSAATLEMKEALRTDRYRNLIDTLIAAAREPALTADARRAAREVLPSLVQSAWKTLAKKGRGLDRKAADEEFHETRIHAKRVRYAAEAVAGSLGPKGKDARKFAKLTADVQDVLGVHQDSAVAREVIEEHARLSPATGEQEFALGRLYEREVQEADRKRMEFFDVWDALDRKRNVAWMNA